LKLELPENQTFVVPFSPVEEQRMEKFLTENPHEVY
jgi:hypothetical protein